MTENQRLLDQLRQISNLLLSEETLKSSLQKVAWLSVRALEPCDGAGVSVVDGLQVITLASSDERATEIDDIQYRGGDGPCLQAIQDGRMYRIDSMSAEKRWPEFVELANRMGVTACLVVPLVEKGKTFGALNLYSYRDRIFDVEDEKAAVALAAQAAGPLANMQRVTALQLVASRLERVLASPMDIAIGVLMERDGCVRGHAMAKLRALADRDGGDLVVAAQSVLASVAASGRSSSD